MKSKSEGQLARARERQRRKYERARLKDGKEYLSRNDRQDIEQRLKDIKHEE